MINVTHTPVAAEAAPSTLSELIRQSTRAHHQRAERSTFQQGLVAGRQGPVPYAAWLGQMLLVHAAMERLEDAGVRGAGAEAWPIERDRYRTDPRAVAGVSRTCQISGKRHTSPAVWRVSPAERATMISCEA